MALRDSTQYTNIEVNAPKLPDARDKGGRVVPIPFTHTVVSGELGGASAGASDEVNLCVLPANSEVIDFFLDHGVMGATSTSGVTIEVGDSGDANRYMVSTDVDVAGQINRIASAGARFRPTADTIVVLQWGGANPVVGQVVKGFFLVVPGS